MNTRLATVSITAAAVVIAAVAFIVLRADEPSSAPVRTPETTPVAEAPASATDGQPASRSAAAELHPRDAVRVARETGKIVYTTSLAGEPMEVFPDGSVIIRNHKTKVRFADGREVPILQTIKARPAPTISRDRIIKADEAETPPGVNPKGG